MISSVKSEEILINIFLKVFFVAIGMNSPKPVFKVSDLNMEHLEVLSLL